MSRKGRHKVKTGCRACKTRKIKCDEGRPSCNRCIIADLVCPGYGVWNQPVIHSSIFTHARVAGTTSSLSCRSPLQPIYTVQENHALDWYRTRTALKISGATDSDFWRCLVLQACAQEAAVFSAVVAISAAHRAITIERKDFSRYSKGADLDQRFVLHQYARSISSLRSRCSNCSRSSLFVALISCVLFASFESLCGRYRTAAVQIQHGKGLFLQLRKQECNTLGVVSKLASWEEDCIGDALIGLSARTALLMPMKPSPGLLDKCPTMKPFAEAFESILDAKTKLDQLLDQILSSRGLSGESTSTGASETAHYIHKASNLEALDAWSVAFENLKEDINIASPKDRVALKVLENHHIMAKITASTNLLPDSTPDLDRFAEDFITIIRNSVNISMISRDQEQYLEIYGHTRAEDAVDTSYIADMGWIPALYFVATKCRHPRIRVHAIRLLQSSDHQEGIWVSHVAAAIAKRIMDYEHDYVMEPGLLVEAFGFSLDEVPKTQSLDWLALPSTCARVSNVQVTMPDDPHGEVVLRCRRMHVVSEEIYDAYRRAWRECPAGLLDPS